MNLDTIKRYLNELDLMVILEDAAEDLVVVSDESNGIHQLVIDCEEPILVLEQFIFDVPAKTGELFPRLLQMNRELVHGAFVLNEDGSKVLWRDTLQLVNLDCNELEGSIRALSLALAENGAELLRCATAS